MTSRRNFKYNPDHQGISVTKYTEKKRDRNKKNSKKTTNLRGYWEASFWQKIVNRLEESSIKEHLGVKGHFDVTKIDKLMNEK